MIKLDLSKICFSKKDILFGVKLPKILTPQLAYETGVHIGDGCLSNLRSRSHVYRIIYSGNSRNEIPFFEHALKPLLKNIYNKNVRVASVRKNECRIEFGSKAIFQFKNQILGLPVGPKSEVSIPTNIFSNEKLAMNCLRGIADTDFSLAFLKKHKDINYYPKIKGDSKSKFLIVQIEHLVKKYLRIDPVVSYDVKRYDNRTGKTSIANTIELNGVKRLNLWMKKIGFTNVVHMKKFFIWKKLGYIPK